MKSRIINCIAKLQSYRKSEPMVNSLFIIDGDNVSVNSIRGFITKLVPYINCKVEIYCNENSAKHWRTGNILELDVASFYLTDNTPQAADLKIMTRMIDLLSDDKNQTLSYKHIYFCSQDKGYRSALYFLARVVPVTVLSGTSALLNIRNTQSIQLNTPTKQDKTFDYSLINISMPLAKIGSILREHDIKYKNLSTFLINEGFKIKNDRISAMPMGC